LGALSVHTPLMHWMPAPAPQQSLVVVHFSYWAEQGGACDVHCRPPPSSDGWQKPPQHWSPVAQPAPLPLHASTVQ
jgi:hypothetical protein